MSTNSLIRGSHIPIFVSWILLDGIIHNFVCNVFTLKDDINAIFAGKSLVEGTVITISPECLGKCRFCVLLN